MKKWLIIVLSLVVFSVPVKADDGKVITVNKMPQAAQEFMAKYFPGMEVAVAKQEGLFWDKSYDVIFNNGNKLEFDGTGDWKSVDCKFASVPEELVPAPVAGYIKGKFPGARILKIEKDERSLDIELDNGTDLEFNRTFELVELDRD